MAQTGQHTEAIIRRGYNMNITTNDKIRILESRIKLVQEDIEEHNRILEEDILQEGDDQVIQNSLSNLHRSLDALNEHMKVLTTG